MRKVFTLAVLALLGCESMGQSFRHHQGPLINRPTPPSTFAFDEVEDNEMALVMGNKFNQPVINRPLPPRPSVLFDEAEDNNLALNLNLPRNAWKDPNSYRVKFDDDFEDNEMALDGLDVRRRIIDQTHINHRLTFDEAEDNEMALDGLDVRRRIIDQTHINHRLNFDEAEDNEMAYVRRPEPTIRPPLRGTGWFDEAEDNEMALGMGQNLRDSLINRSVKPRGNSAFDDFEDNNLALNLNMPRNAWKDPNSYRVKFDETEDNEMFSFNPPRGSTPPFNPSPRFGFDDAEDDELFTQGDMGRMGGFLGSGNSGIIGGGGSAPGGVAWGGAGQYAHNIGRNTQLIGGASINHAPGSRVGINPHVGMKFSF